MSPRVKQCSARIEIALTDMQARFKDKGSLGIKLSVGICQCRQEGCLNKGLGLGRGIAQYSRKVLMQGRVVALRRGKVQNEGQGQHRQEARLKVGDKVAEYGSKVQDGLRCSARIQEGLRGSVGCKEGCEGLDEFRKGKGTSSTIKASCMSSP